MAEKTGQPSAASRKPARPGAHWRAHAAVQYGAAVGFVIVATILRWSLDPVLGEHLPYMIFFLAVVITAWSGSFGPTLLSVLLSWFAANFFFGTPRFSLAEEHPHDWIEAGVFVLIGVCFATAMEARRRARERAEESHREALAQSRLLTAEIDAHRRAEERLRQSEAWNAQLYEKAAKANAAKDEFLAVLSHELRTPLTPVLLTTSWLESVCGLPDELKASMEIIRHNVELEARLIDDLLDLTRIVRGKIELRQGVVDVHHLVEQSLTTCEAEAASRGVVTSKQLQATASHVQADPARLQQVFWNLLKNAVKFTPRDGSVAIRSYNDDADHVVIEVVDTGIGIDPSRLGVIFDAFEQGERSITRQFGGLGLGLAICKRLVDLHGGEIVATSEGKGRGSTFRVRLPTVSAPVAERPIADSAVAASSMHKRALEILLVEDHASTAQVLAALLRKLGHRVTVAATVAGASEQMAQGPFDLLISDLGLPDGSGLDLMRRINGKHEVKGIALSGYGMEEDIARSREAGFLEHVTKPVDIQRLEAVIQRVTA